ncbi:MAG: HIT domain-containing protein [Candidatus Eisenbacteria bacterium]|nr:HIT domain-containing protein [Candidatus Eisenbacteria bacterium]
MAYIQRARQPAGCLFCRARRARSDRPSLVLVRRPHALLMLNRFPYNPAHLMVAVARHVAEFHELTPAERADLLDLTGLAERALAAEYHPHGVNYGANVGRVAGAGYPGHLHLHLVPRWVGDTNFMPTIAGARVLPESLARTWARLRKAIRAIEALRSQGRGGSGRGQGRRG